MTDSLVQPRPGGWPKRYTVVGLCFFAAFICYIDRVNISVAAIAMKDQFGWTETDKGIVLSSFFVGYMLTMALAPSCWACSVIRATASLRDSTSNSA